MTNLSQPIGKWDDIYKKLGIIQKDPMPVVIEFAKLLEGKTKLRILDSGCGTGRHTLYFAERFSNIPSLEINAIDVSEKAVEILKEILKQKEDLVGMGQSDISVAVHDLNIKLNYPDQYFDGIISTLVIEHGYMRNILKWCDDMKRVLKKDGLLCLAVPGIEDPRYLTGEEVEPGTRINTNQTDGIVPHHFFKDSEIEEIFKDFHVIYKKLESRPSVTADVIAKHWEYVLKKK